MRELPYQVIQLDSVDTLVDTGDDFLCDGGSIDVLRVEAITKPRDTGSDLVELHAFFASICDILHELLELTLVAKLALMVLYSRDGLLHV